MKLLKSYIFVQTLNKTISYEKTCSHANVAVQHYGMGATEAQNMVDNA